MNVNCQYTVSYTHLDVYKRQTGKTLEAIAAQGYSYKDGQLEKQQPEATPDSLSLIHI